jgi:hypothetical protein
MRRAGGDTRGGRDRVRGRSLRHAALALLALSLASSAPAAQRPPEATLAFTRSAAPGGVYLLARGRLRLLARAAYDASWSPDGRRLALSHPAPELQPISSSPTRTARTAAGSRGRRVWTKPLRAGRPTERGSSSSVEAKSSPCGATGPANVSSPQAWNRLGHREAAGSPTATAMTCSSCGREAAGFDGWSRRLARKARRRGRRMGAGSPTSRRNRRPRDRAGARRGAAAGGSPAWRRPQALRPAVRCRPWRERARASRSPCGCWHRRRCGRWRRMPARPLPHRRPLPG